MFAAPNLSKECERMILNGFGYRSEAYSGSGERRVLEVVMYEITELGNNDIIETMTSLYGTDTHLWHEISDPYDYNDFYLAMNHILLHKLPIPVNYALWLANRDAVVELYGTNLVQRYSVGQAIVLSDLGHDGVLFGYHSEPRPMI